MVTDGMHYKICDDDTVVYNFSDSHTFCTSCGEIDCQIDEDEQADYDHTQTERYNL